MSIQTHFDKFNKKIYLTNQSPGYKKAADKDKNILAEIKEEFRAAGYPIIETFLQGSFAVDTAINRLTGDYDIDRALVIDADNAPNDPIAPKKMVLKVLEGRNFKNPKIKKPCITADYQSINLHIDYTVYKKMTRYSSNGTYYLAVGKIGSDNNNKEWSESDPKGLIEWINWGVADTNQRKQYKRLVRYIKRWRDANFSGETRKKLFSIGLTVMIKECYPSYREPNDLLALKEVVDAMLRNNYIRSDHIFSENHRVYTPLPTKPYRDIFQHKKPGGGSDPGSDESLGNQFKYQLTQLQKTLQKTIDASNDVEQCKLLKNVFGDDFSIPDSGENKKNAINGTSRSILFSSAGASGTSQGA